MHQRLITTALLATLATPTLFAQGLALQLNTGVDGGIDVPADPLLVPPTGLTVEAWVAYNDRNIPTGAFYWPTIARQNIAPGQEVFNFRVSASNTAARTLQFTVRAAGSLQNVTYTFAANEFVNYTHLAGTYDGQTIKIYKNGVEVATRTLTTVNELVNSGGVLRIGNGDPTTPGRETWNGLLDELRVWPMARTAAEIQATMFQSLNNVAGRVLTFPLDGHAVDTSNGLVGVPFGTWGFLQGAPIAPAGLASTWVGVSSTTCARPIDALLGSLPQIGNAAFAIWATRGPTPANSPFGLLFGSVNQAPPGLPQILGLSLAVDPGTLFFQLPLQPPTTLLGNARAALPIPLDNNLVGGTAVFQWGFFDAACGAQSWTASNGIALTVF